VVPGALTVVEKAPRRAGVSAAIDPVLGASPLEVRDEGRPFADFWIRTEIPTTPATDRSPVLDENVAVSGIAPGALVGVVRFAIPWRDYRDQPVPAGTYTLRYVLQPAIKEHKGVSRYRDFLVLTPIALDAALGSEPADVIRRSSDGFARGHPTVMALFPAMPAARPRIEANASGDAMLVISAGSRSIALVLKGHGRIEPGP